MLFLLTLFYIYFASTMVKMSFSFHIIFLSYLLQSFPLACLLNSQLLYHPHTWNKLDKTVKIQKLTMYAIKYCDENKSDLYDTDILIKFFKNSLENNKLQKKK
jgi:hypothetical protein